MKHIVKRDDIAWSIENDRPVAALCGDFRVRTLAEPDAPVCKECETRVDLMYPETVGQPLADFPAPHPGYTYP